MKRAKILYLDDEYINILAFKAQFRRRFEVFCFCDEADALYCIENNSIDIIFSDQRMPATTGVEFLSKIKKRCPHTPLAIISGYIEDEAIKKGIEEGIINIAFEKPYDVDDIIEYITNNLNCNN